MLVSEDSDESFLLIMPCGWRPAEDFWEAMEVEQRLCRANAHWPEAVHGRLEGALRRLANAEPANPDHLAEKARAIAFWGWLTLMREVVDEPVEHMPTQMMEGMIACRIADLEEILAIMRNPRPVEEVWAGVERVTPSVAIRVGVHVAEPTLRRSLQLDVKSAPSSWFDRRR